MRRDSTQSNKKKGKRDRAFIMQGEITQLRGKVTQEQHRVVDIINLISNEWTSNQSNKEGSCRCVMHIPSSYIGMLDSAQ